MIVIDASAIIAILLAEPEAASFRCALAESDDVRISAMSDYEARSVAFRRRGKRLVEEYDLLAIEAGLQVAAFDREQSLLASETYRRYGRGSSHPPQLDLGDCAAYALAKHLDAPLLLKGSDFARADVRRAL